MRSASKKKTTVVPFQQRVQTLEAVDKLASSVALLHKLKVESITEARIFCAATKPEMTLATIVKEIGMPFSTASRVAWDLYGRGLLTYVDHPTDRRKKIITANVELLA